MLKLCRIFTSFTLSLFLISVLSGSNPAQAQIAELISDLPIQSVSVYPRSAIVTRAGNINIPAGTSTLIIDNLPSGLDAARLQLAIANSGVQFGNLQIQENFQNQTINERENELQNRLQALRDNRQSITDRIETAQSELRLLDNLAGGDAGVRATLNGNELSALLGVVSENSAQARERIRSAGIELRELDRQIEQLQFELNQVAGSRPIYSRLHIRLQADTALSTNVSLSYPQANASWGWLYEARLDTTTRNLSLFRQAAVMQGTGEDWNNITLTLSTANPFSNTRTPELSPMFVDIAQPPPMMSRANRMVEEVVVTGSMISESESMAFKDATVVDTRYQLDYVIPGQVSVAADRQQQVLPVDRRDIAVELITRAVPSQDLQAYLEARFTFNEASPIQAGRMQLYRDGAYIGDSGSPEFLPGQAIRIPFGVDQRIQVQRFDEQQASGNTGIFNRSGLREERIRYEVTSRHPANVKVELLDRIPVSRNSGITVEIPRQATGASVSDFEGQSGILLWLLDLSPQQTATIRHYYDIRHPRDMEIQLQR